MGIREKPVQKVPYQPEPDHDQNQDNVQNQNLEKARDHEDVNNFIFMCYYYYQHHLVVVVVVVL